MKCPRCNATFKAHDFRVIVIGPERKPQMYIEASCPGCHRDYESMPIEASDLTNAFGQGIAA